MKYLCIIGSLLMTMSACETTETVTEKQSEANIKLVNKIVSREDTSSIPFPGHETQLLADYHDSHSSTAVLELDVPAESFGAPPHVHANEDEYFYVLEGKVNFLSEEKVISGKSGDLIILPRENLHGFWNAEKQDAKLLLIISPGNFSDFFDEVVAEIRRTNVYSPEKIGALIGKAAAQRSVLIYPEKTPAEAIPFIPK